MSETDKFVIFRVFRPIDGGQSPDAYMVGICRPGQPEQLWYNQGQKMPNNPQLEYSGASGRPIGSFLCRDSAQVKIAGRSYWVLPQEKYRLVAVADDLSTIEIEEIVLSVAK